VAQRRVQLARRLVEARAVGRVDDEDDAVHVGKVLRPHAADACAAAQVVEGDVEAAERLVHGRGEADRRHDERVHVARNRARERRLARVVEPNDEEGEVALGRGLCEARAHSRRRFVISSSTGNG